jgi:hypothetical protein
MTGENGKRDNKISFLLIVVKHPWTGRLGALPDSRIL